MATFEFQDLSFEEFDDFVRVSFQNNYYFDVQKEELDKIGQYEINKNAIRFIDINEKKTSRFDFIVSEGMKNLTNKQEIKQKTIIIKLSIRQKRGGVLKDER